MHVSYRHIQQLKRLVSTTLMMYIIKAAYSLIHPLFLESWEKRG